MLNSSPPPLPPHLHTHTHLFLCVCGLFPATRKTKAEQEQACCIDVTGRSLLQGSANLLRIFHFAKSRGSFVAAKVISLLQNCLSFLQPVFSCKVPVCSYKSVFTELELEHSYFLQRSYVCSFSSRILSASASDTYVALHQKRYQPSPQTGAGYQPSPQTGAGYQTSPLTGAGYQPSPQTGAG